jgi:hypothetical protein
MASPRNLLARRSTLLRTLVRGQVHDGSRLAGAPDRGIGIDGRWLDDILETVLGAH